MSNPQKVLLNKVMEFCGEATDTGDNNWITPDQNYLLQKIMFFKATAKTEGLHKAEYTYALVAFVLHELQSVQSTSYSGANNIAEQFMLTHELTAEEQAQILKYLEFLQSERDEQNKIEEVLRDTQYLHLGMPDAFEKLSIQRERSERENNLLYTELEWLEKCRDYFIKHSFNCNYTISNFGSLRSKNFIDLEKRIDKLSISSKEKIKSNGHSEFLTDKEGEDMFKLAFRNSVSLISVADKKAGMLIQINTLLAGIVFTFGAAKYDDNAYYLIPTAAILIGSALTVFFGILASRPVPRAVRGNSGQERENIFFGSYDRLDSYAKKVSYEKYSADINDLIKGDKKQVFEGLIRESYEVSKVLSKKFGYLALAYKIFFAGLLLGIVGFLVLLLFEYNHVGVLQDAAAGGPF